MVDKGPIKAYNSVVKIDGEEVEPVNQATVKAEELNMSASDIYIPRTSVESSNLESVGYNRQLKTLEVEFKGNRVYRYYNVPEHVYHDLMNASSHGRFFNREIRGEEKYKFEQV
jgi:hypothetical protein